ncbi:hypothetical protein LOK74_01005 [Brevibacillus humidisoli]|uniref:hypothetical protein n=1 Tax=Brevibacillus humidisoli TaxID=2895522 RepID=UPI001E3B6DD2|nr:hypothetical protein [Brevibacillus humidisoli]UFJ41171.1 hypothetical protein LOK74_01005 [Brevibacillus humidisoli]
MAFGITREELQEWKEAVSRGEIAFLTHYWLDPRFPQIKTVTKVGCSNLQLLSEWCVANGLDPDHIHHRPPFPHFDLIGPKQKEILQKERLWDQLKRFGLLS